MMPVTQIPVIGGRQIPPVCFGSVGGDVGSDPGGGGIGGVGGGGVRGAKKKE